MQRNSKVFFEDKKPVTGVSVQICGQEKVPGSGRVTLLKTFLDYFPTHADFLKAVHADINYLTWLGKDGFLKGKRLSALLKGDPLQFDTPLLVTLLKHYANEIIPDDIVSRTIPDETTVWTENHGHENETINWKQENNLPFDLTSDQEKYELQSTVTQDTMQHVANDVNIIHKAGLDTAVSSDAFESFVDYPNTSDKKKKKKSKAKIFGKSTVDHEDIKKEGKEEKNSMKKKDKKRKDKKEKKGRTPNWLNLVLTMPVSMLFILKCFIPGIKTSGSVVFNVTFGLLLLLQYSSACSVSLKLLFPSIRNNSIVIEAFTTCLGIISWEGREMIGSGDSVYNPNKYDLHTEQGYSKMTVKDCRQDGCNNFKCTVGFHACEINITGSDSGIIRNPRGPYRIEHDCKYIIQSDDGNHIRYVLQIWGPDPDHPMSQSTCSSEFLELQDGGENKKYCRNITLTNETKGPTLNASFHANSTNPGLKTQLEFKIITESGNMQSSKADLSHGEIAGVVVGAVFTLGVLVFAVVYFLRWKGIICKREKDVDPPSIQLEEKDPMNADSQESE